MTSARTARFRLAQFVSAQEARRQRSDVELRHFLVPESQAGFLGGLVGGLAFGEHYTPPLYTGSSSLSQRNLLESLPESGWPTTL